MLVRILIVALTVLAWGCGADAGSGSPSTQSGGAGGGGALGSGGESAGAAGVGASGSAGQAPTGGAGAGGGGAGGSSPGLAPLVPLIEGHVSSFEYTALDPGQTFEPICEAPQATVGGPLTIEGQTGVAYWTPCGVEPYLIEGSGDQLTAFLVQDGQLGMSYEYIHSPVAEGETWKLGIVEQTWRRVIDPILTPAGTFDDCWQRYVPDNALTYCRGIGLVEIREVASNTLLTLTSKNF